MKWQRITEDQRTRSLRVLLLLANWIGGGAERVAVHLMNGLPAHWDIRLGLLNAPGNAYAHLLDPAQIHVAPGSYDFGRPNAELFNVSTIAAGAVEAPRAFRNIIREARPDVVISFLKGTAILTWLALAGMRDRPRWIAREGNNIRATALAESPNALVRGASLKLTGIAYRRADAVIANASAMAGDLTAMFGVTRHRVHAIPNPVDLPGIAKAAAFPIPAGAGRPFLLSVGRLEYQKVSTSCWLPSQQVRPGSLTTWSFSAPAAWVVNCAGWQTPWALANGSGSPDSSRTPTRGWPAPTPS